MYLRYYGFKDYPFSVTPDPAFLYLSASHREALGHLLYGAGEHGGFVQLSGEVGTGKTTLIRALIENDMPDLDIALCWNPHLGVLEFVETICDELGVDYSRQRDTTLKALVDRLNAHLLATHAAGRRTVLIIDEAQNLSRDVLEELRLLTNLETRKHKLLRIILVGQPELDTLLARHDLRQLAQRITARFSLKSLDRRETDDYIRHRLARADGSERLFTPVARWLAYRYSGGIPRLINMVCERALMGAYAHSRAAIGPWILRRAARETLPAPRGRSWLRYAAPAAVMGLFAFVAVLAWYPGIQLSRAGEWIGAEDKAVGGQSGTVAATPEDAAQGESEGDSGSGHAPRVEVASRANSAAPDAARDKDDKEPPDAAEALGEAETAMPSGDADITQLLRLWGVFGSQVNTSCEALRVGDLRCLSERGGFAVLERFNRPALLTLQRDGEQQKVLLSALDDTTATLVAADGTRRIPRERLARLWTGQFEIIWRAQAGMTLIRPGTVGSSVVWLRRRLTRAEGENPDVQLGPKSPIYDADLESRLRHFQLVHGLEPDGMAGPRTQIMLNGLVTSPGSPTLEPAEPS